MKEGEWGDPGEERRWIICTRTLFRDSLRTLVSSEAERLQAKLTELTRRHVLGLWTVSDRDTTDGQQMAL